MEIARQDIQRRMLRLMLMGMGQLGARLAMNPLLPVWPYTAGLRVLVMWSGELYPIPVLDVGTGARPCAVVGALGGLSGYVETYAEIAGLLSADGLYHFAVVGFGAGGAPEPINHLNVQTRVVSDGALLGLLPNAPGDVTVRRAAGNKPHVEWPYSRVGEQAAPSEFRVYARDDASDFNFASPAGTVAFTPGKTLYAWTGTALAIGDIRYYVVRSATSGGVKSLIPRRGLAPSSWTTAEKARCARLVIPAAPPVDPGGLVIEVRERV